MTPAIRQWVHQARQHPALTPEPVCRACGIQRPASAFVGDLCRLCDTERSLDYVLARLEEIERENLRPDGTPECGLPKIELDLDGWEVE